MKLVKAAHTWGLVSSKIVLDDILDSLQKMRIRGSDQLRYLGLFYGKLVKDAHTWV